MDQQITREDVRLAAAVVTLVTGQRGPPSVWVPPPVDGQRIHGN